MPRPRVSAQTRLRAEHEQLLARVQELEETLSAIRGGEVDALVINRPQGNQIFTLQGAEHPYRVLVETMNEGAATLDAEGTVLYSNAPLARIMDVPLEKFIGTPLYSHVAAPEQKQLQDLIARGLAPGGAQDELNLLSSTGERRLVRLSVVLMNEFARPPCAWWPPN